MRMVAMLVLAALVAAATPAPERRFVDEPVHENALAGRFTAPSDGGRHPAVIILGGFEGSAPGESLCLALQGYAAFEVAYFGAPPLPRSADKIPVELVSRAFDWLL